MNIYILILTLSVSLLFTSCSEAFVSEDEKNITSLADSFASHYFNYEFSKALSFCTPESEKWLRYRATNVLQEDIDTLRKQSEKAKLTVNSVKIQCDTLATIVCDVSNHLNIDTLGQPGRMAKDGRYKLMAVRRDDRWMIKMESLPRNERQSHD